MHDVDDEVPDRWRDDGNWTSNTAEFPGCRAMSPGMMLMSRVPVYSGPPAELEFISVEMPKDADHSVVGETFVAITEWNMQWEGGPYRSFDTSEAPAPLHFLSKFEAKASETPASDIVLLPSYAGDIYEKWAPLYHLLPKRTLLQHGLPLLGRGIWPVKGHPWSAAKLTTANEPTLARALAEHLWSHGLGPSGSSLRAFDRRESLVLLSHDLGFWRPHMERLLRETCRGLGRVKRDDDDPHPESIRKSDALSYERPTYGCELWTGEAEASEFTEDLIETADEQGRLRDVIDAIRSNRVQEDFSDRWSYAREDFERKLYRKRTKTRVSFVELTDSVPFHDGNTELAGNMLVRDLLSIVDPKDRRVIVCLHSGHTNLSDIAHELGYANHSPISKSLDRIRKRAQRLLG